LRHGHRHGRKKVLSVIPFVNLRIESNGFKGLIDEFIIFCSLRYLMLVLNDFFNTLNALFILSHHVLPLSDCKVWINTERGSNVISYLCSMSRLNMMEEEFCAHRMAERKRVAYFAIRRKMDHGYNKKK
jgi:hypothetical protein